MDKKEGICFELSEKDILEETEENIFEHITKAVAKATAEGIRANSIVLNGNLVKVPEIFGMNPPMICGLRAYVTTLELPDGYAFSVQDDHMDSKPVTNADRIRAMNDDGLEDFIRKVALYYEPWCDNHCNMCGDDNCNECLAKWLSQPVQHTPTADDEGKEDSGLVEEE